MTLAIRQVVCALVVSALAVPVSLAHAAADGGGGGGMMVMSIIGTLAGLAGTYYMVKMMNYMVKMMKDQQDEAKAAQ